MSSVYFRIAKIKSQQKLREAVKHNLRQIPAELVEGGRIDPAKAHLNSFYGPSNTDDAMMLVSELMESAGVRKPRKDAVRALEFLMSLPMEGSVDEEAFTCASIEWVGEKFGGAGNVISASFHRDEAKPHLHILLVPLINGRLVGSDAVGGKSKLAQLRDSFSKTVALRFGLQCLVSKLPPTSKVGVAKAVLAKIAADSDACIKSVLWQPIRDAIAKDPLPFAETLGIDIKGFAPPRRLRSSTSIFISKGRGSTLRKSQDLITAPQ